MHHSSVNVYFLWQPKIIQNASTQSLICLGPKVKLSHFLFCTNTIERLSVLLANHFLKQFINVNTVKLMRWNFETTPPKLKNCLCRVINLLKNWLWNFCSYIVLYTAQNKLRDANIFLDVSSTTVFYTTLFKF